MRIHVELEVSISCPVDGGQRSFLLRVEHDDFVLITLDTLDDECKDSSCMVWSTQHLIFFYHWKPSRLSHWSFSKFISSCYDWLSSFCGCSSRLNLNRSFPNTALLLDLMSPLRHVSAIELEGLFLLSFTFFFILSFFCLSFSFFRLRCFNDLFFLWGLDD